MARKIWWSKHMSREDKKAVREFLKDYDTEDLTIVFADKYRFRSAKSNKEYKMTAWIGRPTSGLFIFGSGLVFDFAGHRVIYKPAIIINMEDERGRKEWKDTFLHEFGHYLDWKKDPQKFRKRSKKDRERVAREFAALKTL